MYICNRCGELIQDDELGTTTQCHGYSSLGQPYIEVCDDDRCNCGGRFVEATKCKVCGEWYDSNDYDYDVCEVCTEEYQTVGDALEYGAEDTTDVEINGFVASVLSEEQINRILIKWVEENFVDHSKDVIAYCEEDKLCFTEYLIKKYGE